ncbi:hypothetical protein B0H10DRAFT_2131552 [Mycena sp. CBHHK59/15]|nr:hypothetical protein B0H10DRAFT_2131552 [Mycena sp. CBHHK59/15]
MPDSRLDEEGPSEADILDVPLPILRATMASEEHLVFPRSPSPVRTEPWMRRLRIWNIYIPESDASNTTDSAPPNETDNSHERQTLGKKAAATSSPSKKSAASSSAALTRSLSSLSTSEPAPSDSELHKLANLAALHKKEPAGEHRVRSDENDRRLIVWLLMLQKLIEENEKSQSLRIPKPEHLLRHRCLKQLMAEGCDSI